jgi:hypothetical protein
MTWLQHYRLWQYFASSLWILPTLGMVAAIGAIRFLNTIEMEMGWKSGHEQKPRGNPASKPNR